jgi:ferric-dicitrate binding protein FerR (iron transport regulator)
MNDEVLVKYLLDEVSEEERLQVEHWIIETSENKKYFDHFQLIWQKSKLLEATSTVDEDAAWQRFKTRINNSEKPAAIVPFVKSYRWMRVAAILIIALGVSALFYMISSKPMEPVSIASNDGVVKDTLPDNSIITLNKNSTLIYSEEKGTNSYRRASLQGEGFFDVKPDKSKPFVVEVNDLKVEVVGTSFNIKTFSGGTEIIVESGVVAVSKGDKKITLIKGEKLMIPKTGELPQKQKAADKFYNHYMTKQLVCDNTPLWKLVEVLNELYHTNIVIQNDKDRNLPINTTFYNVPLDTVLGIISQTFELEVEKREDRIILK